MNKHNKKKFNKSKHAPKKSKNKNSILITNHTASETLKNGTKVDWAFDFLELGLLGT